MSTLFEETSQALTANDIARLAALLPSAARMNAAGQEVLRSRAPRNLLAAILKETACNLRLLTRLRDQRCVDDRNSGYDALRH